MTTAQPDTTAAVLIVDDEPATAESFAAILKRNGHRVCIARSDAEALAGLADGAPDVAIFDLEVASATAERLQHIDKRPLLIALLKPGSAQRFTREQLSAFDYVFFKAVSPQILADKVAQFMTDRTELY